MSPGVPVTPSQGAVGGVEALIIRGRAENYRRDVVPLLVFGARGNTPPRPEDIPGLATSNLVA